MKLKIPVDFTPIRPIQIKATFMSKERKYRMVSGDTAAPPAPVSVLSHHDMFMLFYATTLHVVAVAI